MRGGGGGGELLNYPVSRLHAPRGLGGGGIEAVHVAYSLNVPLLSIELTGDVLKR